MKPVCSADGSALDLGSRGRGFESYHTDQLKMVCSTVLVNEDQWNCRCGHRDTYRKAVLDAAVMEVKYSGKFSGPFWLRSTETVHSIETAHDGMLVARFTFIGRKDE